MSEKSEPPPDFQQAGAGAGYTTEQNVIPPQGAGAGMPPPQGAAVGMPPPPSVAVGMPPQQGAAVGMPPPAYEATPGAAFQQQVPAPPSYDQLYETPEIKGVPTQWPDQQQTGQQINFLPKLAYADFLPRCLKQGTKTIAPKFDTFMGVMGGLNAWLKANPMYHAIRCETLERKWADHNGILESETTVNIQYEGDVGYVRGVRVWLVPNTTGTIQQIGHINIAPEEAPLQVNMTARTKKKGPFNHTEESSTVINLQYKPRGFYCPDFKTLDETLENFNKQLQVNPIPGKVLSIETFDMRFLNSFQCKDIDPEASSWVQHGNSARFYLSVIRIFYIQGPPEPITGIGLEDFVPEQLEFLSGNKMPFVVPPFETVPSVMNRVTTWVQQLKGKRVTNIQTTFTKISQGLGRWRIRNRSMCYTEGYFDTTYLQVMRVAHVIPFSADPSAGPTMALNFKTFVPLRTAPKAAEVVSQTVERINTWLNLTGVRVVGVETVLYEYSPHARKIDTERAWYSVYQRRLKYWIATVRLHVDGKFTEPPPHLMPPMPIYEYEKVNNKSSACTVL